MTNTAAHDLASALASARTNTGASLLELSNQRPTMAVFLRHSWCPFCLEAMADVKKRRAEIGARGVQIVLVHQMTEAQAAPFFEANGVADFPRIADPDRDLYRALDLGRGNWWQIAGPAVWFRSMQAALVGKRVGAMVGDVRQMPGVFVIDKGRVIASYRHKTQASRPDYVALACPMPAPGARTTSA